jgi:hypothetical protein
VIEDTLHEQIAAIGSSRSAQIPTPLGGYANQCRFVETDSGCAKINIYAKPRR